MHPWPKIISTDPSEASYCQIVSGNSIMFWVILMCIGIDFYCAMVCIDKVCSYFISCALSPTFHFFHILPLKFTCSTSTRHIPSTIITYIVPASATTLDSAYSDYLYGIS